MISTAGRSGSVQTSKRASPAPSRRSGRSSRTHTARTTRPLGKRAATRQLRYRTTSSWPYRIRALRRTGSAATRSGVIRGPYLRGRPRRRWRGGRGTAWSARSRRTRPITAWPSATAASISRARMNQASSRTRTRPSRGPSRRSRKRALLSLPRGAPRRTRRSISGAAPDQAQHQRRRPDPPPVLDDRGPAQPALAPQEPRPVRLGGVVVVHERAGSPGGDPLEHGVVDDAVPDRRLEQRRERRQERLPDREPRPAAALEEPVVARPGARQPGRQDRVGDVAAAGGRGAEQQLGEGGAGAPRHGGGETGDEGGQDRRDSGRGHRSGRRGGWR